MKWVTVPTVPCWSQSVVIIVMGFSLHKNRRICHFLLFLYLCHSLRVVSKWYSSNDTLLCKPGLEMTLNSYIFLSLVFFMHMVLKISFLHTMLLVFGLKVTRCEGRIYEMTSVSHRSCRILPSYHLIQCHYFSSSDLETPHNTRKDKLSLTL